MQNQVTPSRVLNREVWKQFEQTGSIIDYLEYKNSGQVVENDDSIGEVNHDAGYSCDRYDFASSTCG